MTPPRKSIGGVEVGALGEPVVQHPGRFLHRSAVGTATNQRASVLLRARFGLGRLNAPNMGRIRYSSTCLFSIRCDRSEIWRAGNGEEPFVDVEGIGAFVRAKRKELRLTQLEVAEFAKVSDRFLRELEHGKPSAEIGKVIDVLAVLGFDLEPVVRRTESL